MKTLIADIETDGLHFEVSRLWCLGIHDVETGASKIYSDHDSKYPSISEGYHELLTADRIVFHNGLNYDQPVLEQLGYPIDRKKVYDTLVVSRTLRPDRPGGHSLESWGNRLGFKKIDFNQWDRFSDEMAEYLLGDLKLGRMVYDYLLPRGEKIQAAIDLEHEVSYWITKQYLNGFGFDKSGAVDKMAELLDTSERIKRELQEVFPPILVKDGEPKTAKANFPKRHISKGSVWQNLKWQEFNPGSRQQIADRLIRRYDWKPGIFTPSGQVQIDESILSDLEYPEASLLVEYLTIEKKRSMVAGWIDADRNGKIHGSVNPQGTVTGRMTHSSPNVAQADKEKSMRRLFRPTRKDWTQVGCDAEGLELRMMGHYLQRFDGGEFSRSVVHGKSSEGTDAHTKNQRLVGLHFRDSAKTFVYADIYGAGDPKLGKIIVEDALKAGVKPPAGRLAALGKVARRKLEEGIVGFSELKKELQNKVRIDQRFRNIDKRWVWTDSAHACLNYLFQGSGAIAMKKALVIFCNWAVERFGPHGTRWALLANIHDEIQIECEQEIAEEIGALCAQAITEAGICLGIRCPLAGSYKIGKDWSETH